MATTPPSHVIAVLQGLVGGWPFCFPFNLPAGCHRLLWTQQRVSGTARMQQTKTDMITAISTLGRLAVSSSPVTSCTTLGCQKCVVWAMHFGECLTRLNHFQSLGLEAGVTREKVGGSFSYKHHFLGPIAKFLLSWPAAGQLYHQRHCAIAGTDEPSCGHLCLLDGVGGGGLPQPEQRLLRPAAGVVSSSQGSNGPRHPPTFLGFSPQNEVVWSLNWPSFLIMVKPFLQFSIGMACHRGCSSSHQFSEWHQISRKRVRT